MLDWLKQRLTELRSAILHAGIFGSVAKGVSTPNDCDLYVVSDKSPNSDQWKRLKDELSKIRTDFKIEFNLPLNIALLTIEEWKENYLFFLSNSIILIKNKVVIHKTSIQALQSPSYRSALTLNFLGGSKKLVKIRYS